LLLHLLISDGSYGYIANGPEHFQMNHFFLFMLMCYTLLLELELMGGFCSIVGDDLMMLLVTAECSCCQEADNGSH